MQVIPGQAPQAAAEQMPAEAPKPSVTITDNGDGTYSVSSGDEAMESPETQAQEPNESSAPVKSLDEALAKAKTMLAGEAPMEEGMSAEEAFNSSFK